jgi:hypothetical protein
MRKIKMATATAEIHFREICFIPLPRSVCRHGDAAVLLLFALSHSPPTPDLDRKAWPEAARGGDEHSGKTQKTWKIA